MTRMIALRDAATTDTIRIALSVLRKPKPRRSKVVLDYLGASLGILTLSPMLLLIAAAVRLTSRGPVFFRQPRVGLDNRPFLIWKFRTLYHRHADPLGSSVTRDDPRVTPIGKLLRRSSLDEIPQLFNVLSGDMSLVGPRPHVVQSRLGDVPYEMIVTGYAQRHCVKPGITGLAQVNGWRGSVSHDQQIINRVYYDIEYIQRQSLLLDLKIIARTVRQGIWGDNAF